MITRTNFTRKAFNPDSIGGGGKIDPPSFDTKLRQSARVCTKNKTALITQISLFYTALVMTKT